MIQGTDENIIPTNPLYINRESDVVVQVRNLYKSFGDNHVLKGINLRINKGENMVVLGKSGSGKSVLIKCLVRLLECEEGELIVLGQDVASLNDEALNEIR